MAGDEYFPIETGEKHSNEVKSGMKKVFLAVGLLLVTFVAVKGAGLYDEIRKAIIRKHPGGWMERETCF